MTHPTYSGPESLRVGLKTCFVIYSPDDFGTYSTLTTTILNEHESRFLGNFANLLLMLLVVVGSGDGVGEYSVMERFYLSESLWILDIGIFMREFFVWFPMS